jgi:hypothetical protein
MVTTTTTANPAHSKEPRPRREVRDLITDLGRVERRGDTSLISIRPSTLPPYLRDMPVTQEAIQWLLFVSSGGTVTRWLRLNPSIPAKPRRTYS